MVMMNVYTIVVSRRRFGQDWQVAASGRSK